MRDQPIPGLVWAYHFASGTAARPIAEQSCVPDLLPQDGFLWLHLTQADARLEHRFGQLGLVAPTLAAAVTGRDRHLFLNVGVGGVAGQLPEHRREFEGAGREIDSFRFAATDRILVTSRKHPLRAMAALRQDIDAGRRFDSPIALLGAVAEKFELAVEAELAGHAESIDMIEDEVFNGRPAELGPRLGPIRRDVLRMHRTLRTTARLFHRLDGLLPQDLPRGAQAVFEQRGHHFASLDQDVIELAERARLLHDEIDAQRGHETNRNLYILSVATGILLPPTLVTGFFGMNTKDMFLQDISGGTAYALGLVVAAGLGAWLALRRAGVRL